MSGERPSVAQIDPSHTVQNLGERFHDAAVRQVRRWARRQHLSVASTRETCWALDLDYDAAMARAMRLRVAGAVLSTARLGGIRHPALALALIGWYLGAQRALGQANAAAAARREELIRRAKEARGWRLG